MLYHQLVIKNFHQIRDRTHVCKYSSIVVCVFECKCAEICVIFIFKHTKCHLLVVSLAKPTGKKSPLKSKSGYFSWWGCYTHRHIYTHTPSDKKTTRPFQTQKTSVSNATKWGVFFPVCTCRFAVRKSQKIHKNKIEFVNHLWMYMHYAYDEQHTKWMG